jgi:hypothetical protein
MKTIIIFLLISLGVFGQENKKPYPTKIENEIWLNEFRLIQSDSEKITEIKSKIYSDTLFYNYKKRIILDNPRNPEKHICKVLLFIKFDNKYYDLDLLENPKLSKIMDYITLKNIKSIRILENPENVIYFGSSGVCGVIEIECNKKLYRKLKNIF